MKRFKGVTQFMDRHKKVRWRARAKGKAAKMLPEPFGSEAFVKAYEEWKNGKLEIGASKTAPGTIGALIVAYLKVLPSADLADNTKKAYGTALRRFRDKNADKAVTSLTRETIAAKLNAMAIEPSNMLLRSLRRLCLFAVAERALKADPTVGIKKRRPRQKSDGWHTWTIEEVEQFEARHALGTKARLALDLMLLTSARKSDAVTLGRQHEVEGGAALQYRQKKTGKTLVLPILPRLRTSIDATPRKGMTYIETAYGRPFTPAGFGNWFRDRCNEATLPQCSSHGLRKAAATRLADAGATGHEIMAITGHMSLTEVERYTKAADQKRLARGVAGRLIVVKPDSGFAKSEKKDQSAQ